MPYSRPTWASTERRPPYPAASASCSSRAASAAPTMVRAAKATEPAITTKKTKKEVTHVTEQSREDYRKLTRDELEQLAGEPLPDRAAMSLVNANVAIPINAAIATNGGPSLRRCGLSRTPRSGDQRLQRLPRTARLPRWTLLP
jgi:hypothetical protein